MCPKPSRSIRPSRRSTPDPAAVVDRPGKSALIRATLIAVPYLSMKSMAWPAISRNTEDSNICGVMEARAMRQCLSSKHSRVSRFSWVAPVRRWSSDMAAQYPMLCVGAVQDRRSVGDQDDLVDAAGLNEPKPAPAPAPARIHFCPHGKPGKAHLP